MSRGDGKLRSPGSSQPIDLTDPQTPLSLLDHQWRAFKDHVIPLAIPEVQVQEMKRAFYAGAQGVLHAIDDAFAEGLPPEEVGKVLPAIGVEIDRFAAQLDARAEGKAH